MELMGACRFCGQTHMIVCGRAMTQEEIDNEAIMECDCDEAKYFQKKYEAKNYAIANVKELFTTEKEEFIEFLIKCVEGISAGRMTRISANSPEGVKAEISSKDIKIKVTRTVTDKKTLET